MCGAGRYNRDVQLTAPGDLSFVHAMSGEFNGTDRFRIVRRLGAGAYGVVYEAHDNVRDERVALKTLRWTDPAAIYRLKKEFRALADVGHPNLVTLYELFVEGESWFYTMELIDGVDFNEYVRPGQLSVARLRTTLRQVSEGVAAIHASGMLHRDLKPSNVLVSSEGRAVILDFGIAREWEASGSAMHTIEEGVFGTAAYMAPEQAADDAVDASDWYAVGTMLYEALTGVLPYRGSAFAVLSDKQTQDAPSPNSLCDGLPEDLVNLCTQLLARDPRLRPSPRAILGAVGASDSADARAPDQHAGVLAGREAPLAALQEAYDSLAHGAAASMIVQGVSGIGKTTLVQRFLDDLGKRTNAVVLSGRCYVRESVPYKGVDGVIDHLSRYLRTLGEDELDGVLAYDVSALLRLFPVLGRVDAVDRHASVRPDALDPVELRRQAFASLRGLLSRLCAVRPIVIWIDDFQWSDADSLALLDAVLIAADPPALFFVATVRSEAVEADAVIRGWLERARTFGVSELHLEPMPVRVALAFARSLLDGRVPDAEHCADAVVQEAAGSPFLVEQLVRFVLASARQPETTGLSVGDMLEARIGRLPAGARDLFEIVATAGRPISARIAGAAAQVPEEARALLAALTADHLIRATSIVDHIEPYHDRIREALSATIAPDRLVALHLRLALAMELHGSEDVEALYEHFAAGGRAGEASRYAALSAERAAHGLAFGRAAVLYQRALELAVGAQGERDVLSLRVGLADALANAGRGVDAANAYLAAAEIAAGDRVIDLRRRAAEEMLRSGHVDRGLGILDDVFRHVGFRLARSPRHALVRLLWRRIQLRIRGLRFIERDASTLDATTQRRLDVCWAVAIGLARVDNIRAADIQSLNLLLSLDAGEPYRVARALAVEGGFLSTAGTPARARVARLEQVTAQLVERIQHPHASGFALFAAGVARFYVGDFAGSLERNERAEVIFRERCTGAVWELNTSQTYALASLFYLGRWRELARRVPARLREARERGDLYVAADVAAGRPNITWLIADDVAGARAVYRDVMDRWSPSGFHFQHYASLLALGNIDLYAHNGAEAWERTTARWNALRRSMLMRVQVIRIEALHLRARCALAIAGTGRDAEPHLRHAERDAERIMKERCEWSIPLAQLILSAVSEARRKDEVAVSHARGAVDGFSLAGLGAYEAAARRRYGRLIGGDEGAREVLTADAWFRNQGVVNIERMCDVLAPGVPA